MEKGLIMRNIATAVALAMALVMTGTAQAADWYDWEYNLDRKKYRNIRQNPVQPNLAQIGVFGSLCGQCDTVGVTLHSYVWTTAGDNFLYISASLAPRVTLEALACTFERLL